MTASIRRVVVCLAMLASVAAANAQALLGGDFATATMHDFVSFFQFKEREQTAGTAGITEHALSNGDELLTIGVLPDRKIVHLKLIVPRDFIDDPKQTLGGRDMVKSFVSAAMTNPSDYLTLSALMDEVAVRDLDLHPVQITAEKFADSGNPIPKNAYKIGAGPLEKGDRVTFIEKMPVLTKNPSAAYSAFAGRTANATVMSTGTRLEIQNDKIGGVPVLVMDAWDMGFWQKNLASKQGSSTVPSATPESLISQAQEFLDTKDPVKSRLADRDLEQAQKMGSTDFRIAALRALAAIQMGRQTKGLVALKDAIKAVPSGEQYDSFSKQMTATAGDIEKKLSERAPATVPPEERKYEIAPGTTAIIADKDDTTGLITMGIGGGHDPDGGKQDGTDDGIIQVLLKNITQPTEVYRPQ